MHDEFSCREERVKWMYRHRYPTVSTSNLKYTNTNTQIQTEKYKHTNTLTQAHKYKKYKVGQVDVYRYLKVRPTQILYLLSQIPHKKDQYETESLSFLTKQLSY